MINDSSDSSIFIISHTVFEVSDINIMNELTMINLNRSQTNDKADILSKMIAVNKNKNKFRVFLYIEIFISKLIAENAFTEKVRTFLCIEILKRKWNNNDVKWNMNEFLFKILRIMLALTVFTVDEEDSDDIKFDISIFVIYAEAVKDFIWNKM